MREREKYPHVGLSVDRRCFEYTCAVFNDANVKALVCFACARIQLDTGGIRSRISMCSGAWLLNLPRGSLKKNFSMDLFTERYRQSGSPLAFSGSSSRNADFTDWQVWLHPQVRAEAEGSLLRDAHIYSEDVLDLDATALICCPEDQVCEQGCEVDKFICRRCQIPVCRECQLVLQRNEVIPKGLANDNWIGYVEQWIYDNEVTWMEKTVSTKHWTGLMLFQIDVRHSNRSSRAKHKMHDPLYRVDGRIAYKGQLFSAPMDWNSMMDQLKRMEKEEVHVSLPVTGAVLASRVRLVISSGLVDLNKLLKQATVRKPIVLQLIA